MATLAEERVLEAGEHRVVFEGSTGDGNRLPSGVYFVRVRTEHDGAETRPITILK
jgi:hypothetical protein